MLYPSREKPFTEEVFQNPPREYRAAPFWSWNSKLDKEELVWQIEQLKKLGFGGFHMHVRTGLVTPYLSREYMDMVRACIEKARSEDMLAWLYDEDRWPSGAAGGQVTQNPEHRLMHLLLTRVPYGGDAPPLAHPITKTTLGRAENGKLLAVFDIELNADGSLKSYRRIETGETPRGFLLYAYAETSKTMPWYNNQSYVDTLSPKAIDQFIKATHEQYAREFKKDFGGIIPAIFTDEPQHSHVGALNFAHEEKDATLPWTKDLCDTFRDAYDGTDLLDGLPELLWERPGGRPSQLRYRYHDHVSARFAGAFADKCGAWCEDNGILLTGHMMWEPTLDSQTRAVGEAMRSYRAFGIPGIDILSDHREYTTAKQAQSAVHQYGRPGMLSELYGVTNWDFDFRGGKLQGDWQAALGVTVRVPHLSFVSMGGEAKRDYPASYNYQAPWYAEYPYLEDHFARVNTAMTRGKPVVRIGVVHPIESFWLRWGNREGTQDARRQMDDNFQNLTEWLLRGLCDFDFLCESNLPQQCQIGDIGAEGLPVGHMRYDAIVVPNMETIRSTTLDRLEAFVRCGGLVIFAGRVPTCVDAVTSDRPAMLASRCTQTAFERHALLSALQPLRDLDIRLASGAPSDSLFYQLREEKDCRWLFIAQADNPVIKDLPKEAKLHIRIRGRYDVTLCDTFTGNFVRIYSRFEGGWTVLERSLYEHDSLLLRLDACNEANVAAVEAAPSRAEYAHTKRFLSPVPVTLHEPNVLVLDRPEYALDDAPFSPAEEILRLDKALRTRLGWAQRTGAHAQPWVERDISTPHKLRLRYVFHSDLPVDDVKLALENADISEVRLNGRPASAPDGWYVDKSIRTVALGSLCEGENTLEITMPYGQSVNVENCLLLGDFGVQVFGCHAKVTAPVRTLCFGDITRQGLPFYGGNLTYHLDARIETGAFRLSATHYRGHLLKVRMNNEDSGIIAFSPYELSVTDMQPGSHKIDVIFYGCRINTFGQLHIVDKQTMNWGPGSWRTDGANWSYEYQLWPQGVLKSPELYW